MDEKSVTADVVVACIAGFGAWGAAGINVMAENHAYYAAELFGEGADALTITYPSNDATPPVVLAPVVKVTWDQTFPADDETTPADMETENRNPTLAAGSEVEIVWMVSNAKFAATVQSSDFGKGGFGAISIAGGERGSDSVTTTLTVAEDGSSLATNEAFPTTGEVLSFTVPQLTGISALSDTTKMVEVTATLRVTSGNSTSDTTTSTNSEESSVPFPTGRLGKAAIVKSANVVTLGESGKHRTGDSSTRIDIDMRSMLRANAASGPFTDAAQPHAYRPMTFGVTGQPWAAQLAHLTVMVTSETARGEVIHQWDGSRVDSDVAGVLDIDVTGAVREGDMVFVNQMDADSWASPWTPGDKRTIDSGESLMVSEGMAEFTTGGFSIDPGNTDEDDPAETLMFGVYYIPNGKEELGHGSMLYMTAIVNYTRSSSLDERPKSTTTEMRFHGVDDAVRAYAIPFDGNGKGDMANVRIRCEMGDLFSGGKECRPFLECWDDMGMRMFGESAKIKKNALDVLSSMEIESVIGASDPASRHSCHVLSTGGTTVQTLVRDGSSGTLVNNSQVN